VTCFDPDAPTGSGFWHWVLFDLPVSVTELPAGAGSGKFEGLPPGPYTCGTTTGPRTSAERLRRRERHRYVFTVYAVDQEKLGPGADVSPAVVGFQSAVPHPRACQLIGEYEAPTVDRSRAFARSWSKDGQDGHF